MVLNRVDGIRTQDSLLLTRDVSSDSDSSEEEVLSSSSSGEDYKPGAAGAERAGSRTPSTCSRSNASLPREGREGGRVFIRSARCSKEHKGDGFAPAASSSSSTSSGGRPLLGGNLLSTLKEKPPASARSRPGSGREEVRRTSASFCDSMLPSGEVKRDEARMYAKRLYVAEFTSEGEGKAMLRPGTATARKFGGGFASEIGDIKVDLASEASSELMRPQPVPRRKLVSRRPSAQPAEGDRPGADAESDELPVRQPQIVGCDPERRPDRQHSLIACDPERRPDRQPLIVGCDPERRPDRQHSLIACDPERRTDRQHSLIACDPERRPDRRHPSLGSDAEPPQDPIQLVPRAPVLPSRSTPGGPLRQTPGTPAAPQPQAPASPVPEVTRMRRLGRIRRGRSFADPQAEDPDEAPRAADLQQAGPFTQSQPEENGNEEDDGNDSGYNGEVFRATFADHPIGRQCQKTLEYRPRIKFLNALSSVEATVTDYIEAVSQEVCKALGASKCLICFADDIREEVYCIGLDEMATVITWSSGMIGNTIREGALGRFGPTPNEPTLKDPPLEKIVDCVVRSVLCLPIRHMLDQGRTVGAIAAINKIGSFGAFFSDADVKTLQDIVRLVSDSFYRQSWKALEKASSKGDSEAQALISSIKPRKNDNTAVSEGTKMDALSQKLTFLDVLRSSRLSKMQTLGFDALDYSRDDLLGCVELVMQHTGCVERCNIPPNRLRHWAATAKLNYHDNPFHNWYHGFSVFQMCYYQLHASPIKDVFSCLEVFGLLIAGLCHDLDHPGFTNNFMVDSQSMLALRHNDIAVLENHHASLACELLRRDATAIAAQLDAVSQKTLRRVVIKCILDTDMARHSEMCQKLLAAGGIEDRQLMLGACIHAADLSAQVLPWKTAAAWEERISTEFRRQADEEITAGRAPAPFMSFRMDDVRQRGKLQRDFCDFVLLPLWDPYTQLVPTLRPCYRNLVKNRSFYDHRWSTGEDPDPQWCK